ncbi:MAG: hypothetical protein ACHQ50_04200 [Fimbriimonadales bacterium]
MPLPLVFAFLSAPGPGIFDQSVAAHRARKSFSVGVALDATLNGVVTTARYRLAYAAPNQVLLTKLAGGRASLVFWVDGPRFVAYDPVANEMVVRRAPTSGPIVNRVANAIGGLDDPLSAQLSPDSMASFLAPFRSLQGWSTVTKGGMVVLTRPGALNGKKTLSEFTFSASSKLLTKALLIGPTSRLQWVFNYGAPPKRLSFSPPAGAKRVQALSEHIQINASDAKARNLVDRSLRAYARLNAIAYSVTGPDGPSDNWMNGSSFRQRQSRLEWSYHRGILILKDFSKGQVYRGACRPGAILNYLKILKSPMDPVLQALLGHRNPIRGWFLPGMTVSSRGSVSLGSVTCDAVELRSPRLDVSLLIRGDNHLVASATSRVKDPSGGVVAKSEREFKYWSVNRTLPASTFSIPAGKFKPLSKIGK